MKKKLLVLGGFAQHVEIIEHAKKMGHHVIVVDYLENPPGKKIADESYLISITDVDSIVKLCIEKNVDGIMNYCIDPGQKPYQEICEKLDLPCYGTMDQFNILTNKDVFYKVCVTNGLDVIPRYDIDYNISIDEMDNVAFPLVVKPVDGRASKGISVCWNGEQLKPAITYALLNSVRKKIIFEKYMAGDELCAKYFVANGEVYLSSLSDTYSLFENGQKVSINGKLFPSKYYALYEQTDKKVRHMIKQLGIKNGPISLTAFFDEGKFRFFDPSFRLGGAQQWRIEAQVSGVDKSQCMTNFALNGTMGATEEICKIDKCFNNQFGAMVHFILKLGQIGEIIGFPEALKVNSVISYCQDHFEGDIIRKFGTTDQVAFWFNLVSDTKDDLINDILEIQSLISVKGVDGEDMLMPNLDIKQLTN